MKKIFLLLFIFLSTTSIAQNKDYLLSLDGLGAIKLGMPFSDLEKILKANIALKVIDMDSVALTETVATKYKGIDVEIDLFKTQEYIIVNGISASSPLCKTKSGLGIGSTKLQIITAYDGYFLDVQPVYEGDERLQKSKTKATVTVKEDREGNAIVFTLLNNKVISFHVFPIYDDEE